MATWNQNIGIANWQNRTNQGGSSAVLNVSSLNVNHISSGSINTSNLYASYATIPFLSNLVLTSAVLNVSSLNVNHISSGSINTSNLYASYATIPFLSNLVLTTNVIELGVSPTYLTAEAGVLYVNGDAVAFPSSFSTIADWSQFKAVANVDMSRSSIKNVLSISTNSISTGIVLAGNIVNRGISTLNISSGNLLANNINARTGINTLNISSGNLLANNINARSGLSTLNISSGNILARNITTRGFSTLNISSGSITSATADITTQLNVKDIELDTYTYPLYDSNTVYNPTNIVSWTTGIYQAVLTSLNVTPGENIPLWQPNSSYLVNNFTFVVGLGAYKCISNISGSTTSPNGDEFNWIDFSDSSAGSQLWTSISSRPAIKCGIIGDVNSYISVGTIVAFNANISSLTGSYANNVSSQLSVLSNLSTTYNPTAYSNWSFYPARGNVDFGGYGAYSLVEVNTGSLTATVVNTTNTNSYRIDVGNGGQSWNGNMQINGTGNTFSDFWYNFVMDANITTGQPNQLYPPNNAQYFRDWSVNTNCPDAESIPSFALTTTKLHTYTAGLIIPTGYIDFRAHNYRVIPVLPVTTLDYRGQFFFGTEGYGANAYIGINYDSFETVPNVGTSIILNADSVAGSVLAGFSRITSQSARNQMLATVQTQIYAGYLGVDPAYTYYAGFEQSLLNAEGGGATQTMRSRGADVLGFPGSRTDITSECPENTSVPSQMNIYSSQNGNLYTDGDFYIGYGGSVPRYGFNSANQQIHIVNANDIQGRPNTGVTITNVNSVQGINSNSFINNIHYLVGYDTDVAFDINYLEFPREVRSTIDFKYSTIEFFSNAFVSSVNQYFTVSTLSTIVFAQSSYTSSFILNKTDVSSFKTNINSFNVNKFNEILGISTILSSFIINVDRASIKQIDKVSTIRSDNGLFSNITNSNIINTNIITATTANFLNLSTGTIRPTNISTLNISTGTIRANEGFFSTLYGNTGNFNNLSTNQLVARDGVFDGVSTNNISTKFINALITNTNLLNVQSIYNQFYSEPVAFPDNDVDFVNHNILNVKDLTASSISTINISTNSIRSDSLSTNTILTSNISTNTLNMITGTGNVLSLKSYGNQDPILAFERTIDGVETPEGGFGSINGLGFVLIGTSTFTIQANDDIKIETGQNIRLSPQENVIVSASNLIVNRNANISSINTNFISTLNINATYVDLYSQDADLDPAIVFSRSINGEKFGDGSITTNNTNGFQISAVSTMTITTVDDMIIRSIQGNIGMISDSNNIIISAPETIIPYNLNVSSISTGYVIAGSLIAFNGIGTANVNTSNLFSDYTSTGSIYANSATIVNDLSANNLFTTNLLTYFIGNPLPFQSPVTFNDNLNISGNDIYNTATLSASNISTNFLSTGSLFVDSYTGNSISTNLISSGRLLSGLDITTPAISTTTISTSVLNTNSINAPVNINFGKSIIPFSGNNLDIGASGAFRWRNLWVSTISSIHTQSSTITATTTITASTIAIDRLVGNASATNIYTNNLFPLTGGAQLGYNSGGTAGGGFYNVLAARSTFTQVINPSGEAGRFSNAVYINTNLSTQNVMVSSINNKLYPYTSTLNIPFSSFSITGNQAGTPILLYSNIDFRTQGFHRISQKAILSKNSGGASADIHGNIFYSLGSFPSTPSITDGYSALPVVNQDNASTFTTLMTEFYVSTPTTRSIFYYDATANNYTSRLYMGSLFDSVTPDFGNNFTRIPSIL